MFNNNSWIKYQSWQKITWSVRYNELNINSRFPSLSVSPHNLNNLHNYRIGIYRPFIFAFYTFYAIEHGIERQWVICSLLYLMLTHMVSKDSGVFCRQNFMNCKRWLFGWSSKALECYPGSLVNIPQNVINV